MTRFDQALAAFQRASIEEDQWPVGKPGLLDAIDRRDAAMREIHAAEDPWQPCVCEVCAP